MVCNNNLYVYPIKSNLIIFNVSPQISGIEMSVVEITLASVPAWVNSAGFYALVNCFKLRACLFNRDNFLSNNSPKQQLYY